MTEPRAENPKHVELQQAIDVAKAAADRVTELRQALVEQDEPREWSISHDGVYDWTIEFVSETNFATCWAKATEVKAKILDAVSNRPFDRSQRPYDVKARATCAITGERIEVYVVIEQDEPVCPGHERHEWVTMNDEQIEDSHPRARVLTEGCLHCECRKETTWRDIADPDIEVRFDTHHYPEGTVARRQRAAG